METKKIKTTWEPIKILTKKDTSREVSVENIPWVNIEQLYVWQEVQRPREVRGEFNTNDASLTRVNNFYNLNLPDPENEIFSFAIDGIDMTFGVGNFWANPTLAYETVETQLQDKLWDMYTVEYVGSGNYTIVKEFERTISFAEINLVRNIEFTDWNEHTKVDVIIDGQTIAIDWDAYPLIASAIDYIISQLSTSVYYAKRDSNNLVIARIDTAIPVITQTNYDRYTYNLLWRDSISSPTSSELGWIDGSNNAKAYSSRITINGVNYQYDLTSGITWDSESYDYDAVGIAWSPNWTISNWNYRASALADIIWAWFSTWYIKWPISFTAFVWLWVDRNHYTFDFYDTNRTRHTLSNFEIDYVIDSTIATTTLTSATTPSSTQYSWIILTETNNLVTLTITNYNEITPTFTSSGNNFFIRVDMMPTSIQIWAYSSVGTSIWTYEKWEQSTTLWDGSATVQWRVFQTDASNYGTIIKLVKWWFIINFTTTVGNIINYTCR